jgi:UDP-3-O-[3-hydroxymyristoyl] N-acetylglucosamine deacetylase
MVSGNTIQKEVQLSGIGIHTGEEAKLSLLPSSSGELVLRRQDLNNLETLLDLKKIKSKRSSLLDTDEYEIFTLEHLLAALYIFGVDSLTIILNGNEIPIMDGSAAPFVRALLEAGIKPTGKKRKILEIRKSHSIQRNDAYISISASPNLSVDYAIEYDHPVIKKQKMSLVLDEKIFIKEIAPARTFGFLREAPQLWNRGLALGGSFENALVLDDENVINGPLRFQDEFIRHKILDLVGDLALLDAQVSGHFKAHKAGHHLHLEMLRFLSDNPDCWEYT